MTHRSLLAAAAVIWMSGEAQAQFLQPELRLDALGPSPISIEPGLGATAVLGNYVRIGVAAGYDVRGHASRAGRRWRGDFITRVSLDPFRQQRWGLSIGGGLSYRGSSTYLAAVLDLEGPEARGLLPALQIGVSGGVRVGVILRRAIRGRR